MVPMLQCLGVQTWALAGAGGARHMPPPVKFGAIIKIIKVISEGAIANINTITLSFVVGTHTSIL
jgi:hypothetical protein